MQLVILPSLWGIGKVCGSQCNVPQALLIGHDRPWPQPASGGISHHTGRRYTVDTTFPPFYNRPACACTAGQMRAYRQAAQLQPDRVSFDARRSAKYEPKELGSRWWYRGSAADPYGFLGHGPGAGSRDYPDRP